MVTFGSLLLLFIFNLAVFLFNFIMSLWTPKKEDAQEALPQDRGDHPINVIGQPQFDRARELKRSPLRTIARNRNQQGPTASQTDASSADSRDLLTSAIVATATHSAPISFLAGGSIAGAVIGSNLADILEPHEESASTIRLSVEFIDSSTTPFDSSVCDSSWGDSSGSSGDF